MIALAKSIWTVADLLRDRHLDTAELAACTGLEFAIVDAVVHQRYTPSLDQRLRISSALGVPPGHPVTVCCNCLKTAILRL